MRLTSRPSACLSNVAWALLFSVLGIFPPPVQAAKVLAFTGEVQLQRGGAPISLKAGTELVEGDALNSASGGEAVVQFDDGAKLALRSASLMSISKLQVKGAQNQREKIIELVRGGLRYISGLGSRNIPTQFMTATAAIGIRGTDIEITIAPETGEEAPYGTYLKVNTGAAALLAVDGTEVNVAPGEVAFGGEPELVPRGPGGKRRPAGRKLESSTGLFKPGLLDNLLR
jgi:hypothetical protein